MLIVINVCPFTTAVKVKVAFEFTLLAGSHYSGENKGDTELMLSLYI